MSLVFSAFISSPVSLLVATIDSVFYLECLCFRPIY